MYTSNQGVVKQWVAYTDVYLSESLNSQYEKADRPKRAQTILLKINEDENTNHKKTMAKLNHWKMGPNLHTNQPVI